MRRALLFCCLSSVAVHLAPAADPQSIERAFKAGGELMQAHKFCEALAAYRSGIAADQEQVDLLYNGSLAAIQCGDFNTAADLLTRLKALDPDDWQARAKLVQTYQTLGKLAERDKEREALFALRKSGTSPELSEQEEYCRERFDAAGEHVMAFEHFELKGDRAVKYVFDVMNDAGDKPKYYFSLGSYDLTNNLWHQNTTPAPPADLRLFHLDGYWDNGHATYGMFVGEPTYEAIRALIVSILKKEVSPVSSSSYGSPPAQKKP